jgi:LCP family protein required for cell wall assembly
MIGTGNYRTSIVLLLAVTVVAALAGPIAPSRHAVHAAAKPRVATTEVNILLMGSDARPGEEIDEGVRPDALAVLHLDPDEGTCRLLSIPRDSRVEVPGYGMTKINHALMVGGIPLQRQTVEDFLDIEIDHYGLIDFVGAEKLFDAIGGVTVTNEYEFAMGDHAFPAGEIELEGWRAVLFARYRGGPDGDFGRMRRQQDLIRSTIDQLTSEDLAPLIRTILPLLKDHIRTDLRVTELIALATTYQERCTAESMEMLALEGGVGAAYDPLFNVELSYVIVDEDEVRRKVDALTVDGPNNGAPTPHPAVPLTPNA